MRPKISSQIENLLQVFSDSVVLPYRRFDCRKQGEICPKSSSWSLETLQPYGVYIVPGTILFSIFVLIVHANFTVMRIEVFLDDQNPILVFS